MSFDVAVIETGNGGDLQLVGNDLGLVYGIENMIYLGLFGGNKDEVTQNRVINVQSFDWWGNNLFMRDTPGMQFNSTFEKALRTTELTSSGRSKLENAAKTDLAFFSDIGAKVEVNITIVSTDRIDMVIKVTQKTQEVTVTIINFKKSLDGDFYIDDFNDDFLV